MILEVDIGNTRIKWRLREAVDIVSSGSVCYPKTLGLEAFDDIFSGLTGSINCVLVGSVVPSCHEILVQWCQERLACTPQFALVAQQRGGVVNGYNDISQMGIDRWLALLAAWHLKKQSCLIVDAGSAVTIDLLLDNGIHHGGYIIPGLRLMNEALFMNTDKVKVSACMYPSVLQAGKGTREAVLMGLPLMLVGAVKQALDQMRLLSVAEPLILVTGGDGHYLADLLRIDTLARVEYVNDLVLDGLVLAVED